MQIPDAAALFDLSGRAKYRITGTDRTRFLNGQLTNDVRKAEAGTLLEACILSAKGKLNGHLFLAAESDAFLLDADDALRETLPARLERYVIADDVQISDISDDFGLLHVVGGTPSDLPQDCVVRRADRFGLPGWDVRFPRPELERIKQQLLSLFSFCDEACAETWRIERGIPRWGEELTEEIIPVEANLQERTIDYTKGCYIGQETISRMKMSGQTNKRLCGLISLTGSPLRAGMRLVPADEAKDVGWITSATMSSRLGKQIALGYVKRGFSDLGTHLRARDAAAETGLEIEVAALPFV
ncbi:MAG: glycine cleavage T C-terminal barrel domain-containing protein [Chthoniobacterales bacterium]